ncbi:hypothetical protein I588_04388 [Enterococcus pallens ATCC BAA-351]|uniref:DUF1659 domain-containing protein n=1 Tax=Enterococcus pallens ATCC BAA-351 TaxID=1158607 RepID=R2QIE5_9ENTE|nr:hypothetical protein UAU_01865 [Enterococcus pallens ATCC BAA-351]EOU14738.1 hypothetical protein I588_04388 [Enterococcus pallens ATCC BAA-351]
MKIGILFFNFFGLLFSHRPEQKNISQEEHKLIQQLGTKLQIQIEQAGKDKQKKVNFSNIITNPAEADITKLGEVMADLAGDESSLDSVIVTNQTRVTK